MKIPLSSAICVKESRKCIKIINLFSSARRTVRHQKKVKVKGLGLNISNLIFDFFHGSTKKFNQLAKKKKKKKKNPNLSLP